MVNKGKIRVAMVVPAFPLPEVGVNGGIQGVSLYLSQALTEMPEVDLQVIMPMALPGDGGLRQIYGLQVHFLEQKRAGDRYIYSADLSKMQRLIKDLSPDIVHFQGLTTWANQCPFPNIVTIHGIAERDVLYRGSLINSRLKFLIIWLIEGRARRKARNLIVINPYVYRFLGSRRTQQVWDIPNPVSREFFTIDHQPEFGRIFSASHMIPLKNIIALIKAFAQIADSDPRLELRLAGSGQDNDYGQECRSLVNALGLNDRVKFLGLLPLQSIREELSRAACFALCSYQENAPLSISEAMAAGVPVIASRAGGIPWMVTDGLTGVLVNVAETIEIARSLKQVLFSDDCIRMGNAARQTARKQFYPAEVAKRTLDAYQFILNHQNT
jgi:glycosyltransferase involved in cell wall biosynthesis